MPIRRFTVHLDETDMRALARLAQAESRATGIRVTAAGMVRRLIKQHLRAPTRKRRAPR